MTREGGLQSVVRWAILFALAGAILFGGGGAEGPLNNGIIYAGSAILLLILAAAHASGWRPLPREALVPVWLLVAVLIVGSVQLIPLPPSLWRELPGRDLAISSLALVGADHGWRPLSLDAEATRRAITALLLPAAVIIAVLGASYRHLLLLLRLVLACAVISAGLGVLQLAGGFPDWLMPYEGLAKLPTGIFANVNHQATFLLSAIACIGLAVRLRHSKAGDGHRRRFDPTWLLLPFFIVMVLATQSRAGSLLLALAVPGTVLIGFGGLKRRAWMAVAAATGVLGLLAAAWLLRDGRLADGLALVTDPRRAAIIPDVLFTLWAQWPWGSGLGTFVPVFAANENLDLAGSEFVNHAHNDVLELIVETGLAGTFLLILAAGAMVARIIQVQRGGQALERAAAWTGCLILGLLFLHSLVDYPVRMASVAAVAGLAFGLLFAPLGNRSRRTLDRPRRPSKWLFVAGALLALVCSVQVVRLFAAQAAVRNGDGATSSAIRPQNGGGLALASEEALARRDTAAARSLAAKAITAAPLSSRAVRVMAIAEGFEHGGGTQAWLVASGMGWRDGPTQYWAMQQALASKEYETAAIRADAFMRTAYRGLGERVAIVRLLLTDDPFRAELVKRLELGPPWTTAFFNVSNNMPDPQVNAAAMVLRDLAKSQSRPRIEGAMRVVRVLLLRKRYAESVALHEALAGEGAATPTGDLVFARSASDYADQRNPFDWAFRNRAGAVTSVEQSDDGRVLLIGTDGRDRHRPVVRYAALAPGAYRLRYAMRGSPETPEIFAIAAYCAEGLQRLGSSPVNPLRSGNFEEREFRFSVPASCPMVLLAFDSGWSHRPSEAEFANLSLSAE